MWKLEFLHCKISRNYRKNGKCVGKLESIHFWFLRFGKNFTFEKIERRLINVQLFATRRMRYDVLWQFCETIKFSRAQLNVLSIRLFPEKIQKRIHLLHRNFALRTLPLATYENVLQKTVMTIEETIVFREKDRKHEFHSTDLDGLKI